MLVNRRYIPLCLLNIAFFLMTSCCLGQYFIKDSGAVCLNGSWLFAMDPLDVGAQKGWFRQDFPTGRWDEVQVPHCFSTDKRYEYYTGTAWYRRDFEWTPKAKQRVILHFDGVYYLADIWINNEKVFHHEGGYTPFEMDITTHLKNGRNTIALSVNNNTWNTTSVPGAKDDSLPGDPFMGWMNYGGITRPVYLTEEPEAFISNMKIEAAPDLKNGTASIKVKLFINQLEENTEHVPGFNIYFRHHPIKLKWSKPVLIRKSAQLSVWEIRTRMQARDVRLWNLDHPSLYTLQSYYNQDTATVSFGVRKVEVKGVQLLLNGMPIRAAGANRIIDYPGLGATEPDSIIEKDFRLMKQAGMVFQRLTHYTPDEYFYELADRYGMLIIAEAGNWQLTSNQMDNDSIRQIYKSQFSEMIHRDWNHPSLIAYSVGNEYASDEPAGQKWTSDMIAYGKQKDHTRLFTFASSRLNKLPGTPIEESSRFCDFICTNTYGNHPEVLEHIHGLYPDKPILMSEWGQRVDYVGDTGLVRHIMDIARILRTHPYVIGASIWSYNDYESRFSGSNINGYRPWGLVDPNRNPRQAYLTFQREMCPVQLHVVKQRDALNVQIWARKDFPSYQIKHYYLKAGNKDYPIENLNPGDTTSIVIPVKSTREKLDLGLYTPTGFKILHEELK